MNNREEELLRGVLHTPRPMCFQLEHGMPIEPMHMFKSESSVLEWHLLCPGQVVQRNVSTDSGLQSVSESRLQFHRESSQFVHLFAFQLLGFCK